MVNVVDSGRVLTQQEARRLARFVVEHCYNTTEDVGWLKEIVLQNDGACEYLGYWECDYAVDSEGRAGGFEARIVLNTGWLTVIEDMEETLAHEYGHHWTLGHLLTRGRLDDARHPAPPLYYRLRRLDQGKYRGEGPGNDSYEEWLLCDKEVLAEDYRCLLTEKAGRHEMEPTIGLPSAEVGEFLRALGSPAWLTCPTCPPLTLE